MSIRWLNAGKILKHFFGLRKKILSFFQEQLMDSTGNFQAQLQSTEFLCGLAFLTDMTNHLNLVNLSLQEKGQSIFHLVGHVESFSSKLRLFTTVGKIMMLLIFRAALSPKKNIPMLVLHSS